MEDCTHISVTCECLETQATFYSHCTATSVCLIYQGAVKLQAATYARLCIHLIAGVPKGQTQHPARTTCEHAGAGNGDAFTESVLQQRRQTGSPRDCRVAGPIKSLLPKITPGVADAIVNGICVPDGLMLTNGDMAYVLNQEGGKLRIKEIKVCDPGLIHKHQYCSCTVWGRVAFIGLVFHMTLSPVCKCEDPDCLHLLSTRLQLTLGKMTPSNMHRLHTRRYWKTGTLPPALLSWTNTQKHVLSKN